MVLKEKPSQGVYQSCRVAVNKKQYYLFGFTIQNAK